MIRYAVKIIIIMIFLFAHLTCQKESIENIIEKTKPAVVTIIAFGIQKKIHPQFNYEYWERDTLGLGSGFFINKEGYLITNYHVLTGSDSAIIKTIENKIYNIRGILAEDRMGDLIMVKVDIPADSVRYLKISKECPREGSNIIVIGSPLGLEHTISNGIVSSIRDIENVDKLIQITAPISPGSSGGPVLNEMGKVIGVASYNMIGGQNLNFAIPGQKVLLLKPLPFEEKDMPLWCAINLTKEITNVDELVERGYRYFATDNPKFDVALMYLQKAYEIAPNATDVNYVFARYYDEQKQFEKAVVYVNKLISLEPSNCEYYSYLGELYFKMKNYETAIDNFQKALELTTEFIYKAHYINSMAYCLSELGKHEKAIKMMKLSLEVLLEGSNGDPTFYYSHKDELAYIYRKAGKYTDAIKIWIELIKYDINYFSFFKGKFKKINGFYVFSDSIGNRIIWDYLR
jgi:Tfp pilus assembly protein PilF